MANLSIGIDSRGATQGAANVTSALKSIVSNASSTVKSINNVNDAMKLLGTAAGALASGGLNSFFGIAISGFTSLFDVMMTVLNPLNWIKGAFDLLVGGFNLFTNAISGAFSILKSGLSIAADFVMAFRGIWDTVTAVGQVFVDLGTTVMTALTDVVTVGADFNKAMADIQSISGATAESLQVMREAALQVGRDFPLTAEAGAQAMKNLQRAGLDAAESISALSPAVQAAIASETSLDTVSKTLIATTNAMGLSFDDSEKTLNVLLATTQKSAQSMEGLSVGLSYVAPALSAMNQDLNTGVAMLGKLADAGFEGSRAGTGLNQILMKLATPTKAIATLFSDAGFKLDKMTGKFEELNPVSNDLIDILKKMETAGIKASDVVGAFGVRAGQQMAALLKMGAASVEELKNQITGTDSAAEMFAIQMDTLKASMESIVGSGDNLKITLGTIAERGLKLIVDEGIKVINFFDDFIKQTGLVESATQLFTAVSKEAVEIFNLMKPAIDPVLEVLASFGIHMTTTTEAWKSWIDKASEALSSSRDFNSILQSVGSTLATYLTSFLEWVTNVANLENAFNTAVAVGRQFYELISSIGNIAGSVASGVAQIASNFLSLSSSAGIEIDIVGGLQKTFQDAKNYIMNDAKKTLEEGLTQIGPFIAGFFTTLSPEIRSALDKNDWDGAFQIVKDKVEQYFLTTWMDIKEKAPAEITKAFDAISEAVGPGLKKVFEQAQKFVVDGLNKLNNSIRERFGIDIKAAFQLLTPIVTNSMKAIGGAFDIVTNKIPTFAGKVVGALETTGRATETLTSSTTDTFSAYTNNLQSISEKSSQTFATDIPQSIGVSNESFNNLKMNVDTAIDSFGDASSHVDAYREHMAQMSESLDSGGSSVEAYNQHIANMKTQFEETKAFSEEFAKGGHAVGLSYMENFAEGQKEGFRQVSDVLNDLGKIHIGQSPPPEGPLKNIDIGGRNVAAAWNTNFVGTLSKAVTEVEPIFSQLNSRLSAANGFFSGSAQSPSGLEGGMASVNNPSITENKNINQTNSTTKTVNDFKFNVNVNGTGTPDENRQAGITFAEAARKHMQKTGVVVR